MRYVVAADAWFQKRFDGAVHWVMWTCGVSKGFVRYSGHLTAAGACLIGTKLFEGFPSGFERAVDSLLVAFLVLRGTIARRIDDEANANGRISTMDRGSSVVMRCVWWTWLLVGIAVAGREHSVNAVTRIPNETLVAALLAEEYLRQTPPFPPERRKKKLVMATENA